MKKWLGGTIVTSLDVDEVFDQPLTIAIEILKNPEADLRNKITALLIILNIGLPSKAKYKLRSILERKDLSQLPFTSEQLKDNYPIHKGYKSDVFLLRAKEKRKESFVIKIEVNNSKEKAEETAKQNQKDFDFLQNIYGRELISDEINFISEIDKDGEVVNITLQPFTGHKLKDFFSIGKDRLINKFLKNKELRKSFLDFVHKTILLINKGRIIDLIGKKNLVIVTEQDNEERLKFIDPHLVIDIQKLSESKEEESKNELKEIHRRLDYIVDIYNQVNKRVNISE